MEAWTGGKVSGDAMRYWQKYGGYSRDFTAIRGGYIMHGWESEIAHCRAYGRGWRSGGNKQPHKFDILKTQGGY